MLDYGYNPDSPAFQNPDLIPGFTEGRKKPIPQTLYVDEKLSANWKKENEAWLAKVYARHPNVDGYLKSFWERVRRQKGYKEANTQLRKIDNALRYTEGKTATMDMESISDLADYVADECLHHYKVLRKESDIDHIREKLSSICKHWGIKFPLFITRNDDAFSIAKKIISAAERCSDPRWWRRQLRKMLTRRSEAVIRQAGFVRKAESPYVSKWALARWEKQQKRNVATLDAMECVTTDAHGDDVYVSLSDCVKASVSNPENRRHELMTRVRGYEEVAVALGLVGLFFTLTCPSRFHAYTKHGTNAKHDGSTPSDAMTYLNGVWSRIRADWAREEFKTFGFRVCEPHHDGTPHMHFWLFVNPADKNEMIKTFGAQALKMEGDEEGAAANRWDVKEIDPAQGSAAGYIAKYIAKNIDGFAVGTDDEGEVFAEEGAKRVRAWASIWGIRQFQQIGAVSVTVWRELRRNVEAFEHLIADSPDLDVVDRLRLAADAGDWAEFVKLMGGAFVTRGNQPLRPMYVETGEGVLDQRYGEDVKRLIGLWISPVVRRIERFIQTRDRVWSIRLRRIDSGKRAASPPVSDLCQ